MGTMRCGYYDSGRCRSCALMGEPYEKQLANKDGHARDLLAPFGDAAWLPPVAGRVRLPEHGQDGRLRLYTRQQLVAGSVLGFALGAECSERPLPGGPGSTVSAIRIVYSLSA